jgi:hypothetical protein
MIKGGAEGREWIGFDKWSRVERHGNQHRREGGDNRRSPVSIVIRIKRVIIAITVVVNFPKIIGIRREAARQAIGPVVGPRVKASSGAHRTISS